ncbi:cytochrome c [Rhodoferax sp. GW822-FHT02A01]|uniref:cytochrome c n=1 Tax=Rhodoferax sp. GW822-FHT02A01 TaxID=3141537 RepID=UPI00315CF4DC
MNRLLRCCLALLLIGATSAFAATAPSDTDVQRGEYLARAADCISCHTRAGGLPFAGGLAMATPFGTIVSTNITPDRTSGIGNYSAEEFSRALRQGRAKDGHYLYPAMPYVQFTRMTDADVLDLYAYFMKAVKPEQQDNVVTRLAWPFSMRGLMALWNMVNLQDRRFAPVLSASAEWNRGAYLVQGLSHCSACHTPRNFIGAEKASSEKDGAHFLAGASIDGWYALPLRELDETTQAGLASWSQAALVQYLHTGRNAQTAAFGAMAGVVSQSTQYLTLPDANAIAVYLKSLGASEAGGSKPVAPDPQDPTTLALRQGDMTKLASRRGALIYLNNCSACHRSDGQGAGRTFPTLSHSSAVAAGDTTSLVRIVLQGSAMPYTVTAPSELGMPPFGWRLSNTDIADVLSFVRSSWGNNADAVTAQSVAQVRSASKVIQATDR